MAMDQRNERGIQHAVLDLLHEVEALDPLEGRRFVETMRAFRPASSSINGVRTAEDVKLGFADLEVCVASISGSRPNISAM